MNTTSPGSFRLFRLWGIDVFLHWSWFLVAFLMYSYRPIFSDPVWHIATYISLFAIVLMHEFGHALACRSVGGIADRIVLWPLGGIAFVQPPPRPGAVLWSIAAGPLVNVVLVPVSLVLLIVFVGRTDPELWTPAQNFVVTVAGINVALLVFNMLPIYPLDGGQILQAILWFKMGFAKSLRATAWIGLIAAAAAIGWALANRDAWIVVLALFVGWRAWLGLRMADYLIAHGLAGKRDLTQSDPPQHG